MKHLFKDIYLDKDDYCLTLKQESIAKTGKNKGKKYYSVIGYYPNYKMMFKSLCERGFNQHAPSDLMYVIDYIEEAVKAMNEKIDNGDFKKWA